MLNYRKRLLLFYFSMDLIFSTSLPVLGCGASLNGGYICLFTWGQRMFFTYPFVMWVPRWKVPFMPWASFLFRKLRLHYYGRKRPHSSQTSERGATATNAWPFNTSQSNLRNWSRWMQAALHTWEMYRTSRGCETNPDDLWETNNLRGHLETGCVPNGMLDAYLWSSDGHVFHLTLGFIRMLWTVNEHQIRTTRAKGDIWDRTSEVQAPDTWEFREPQETDRKQHLNSSRWHMDIISREISILMAIIFQPKKRILSKVFLN